MNRNLIDYFNRYLIKSNKKKIYNVNWLSLFAKLSLKRGNPESLPLNRSESVENFNTGTCTYWFCTSPNIVCFFFYLSVSISRIKMWNISLTVSNQIELDFLLSVLWVKILVCLHYRIKLIKSKRFPNREKNRVCQNEHKV